MNPEDRGPTRSVASLDQVHKSANRLKLSLAAFKRRIFSPPNLPAIQISAEGGTSLPGMAPARPNPVFSASLAENILK